MTLPTSTTRIAAALLLAASGAAFAADAPTDARWKSLDADGDGKISIAENRAQADMAFKEVDRDGDGAVSPREYGDAIAAAEAPGDSRKPADRR